MKTERCIFLKAGNNQNVFCAAWKHEQCPKKQLKYVIGARCWSVKINVTE